MRLMPNNGLKSNPNTHTNTHPNTHTNTSPPHAPLTAARQRVKYSWKALKESLHFSLNTKHKPTNGIVIEPPQSNGHHSKNDNGIVEPKKDVQLILPDLLEVESLVDQNIHSFLADTEDYDGIAELFEKYRHERDAFQRLKNKLNGGDVASEFSEMSSISELSISSDSDDAGTIISGITNVDFTTITDNSPVVETASCSSKTLSTSGSSSYKRSPTRRCSKSTSTGCRSPRVERTRVVSKPLPSLMKPVVPDISKFDDTDLNNVVSARATSDLHGESSSEGKTTSVDDYRVIENDETSCLQVDVPPLPNLEDVIRELEGKGRLGNSSELNDTDDNSSPLLQLFNKVGGTNNSSPLSVNTLNGNKTSPHSMTTSSDTDSRVPPLLSNDYTTSLSSPDNLVHYGNSTTLSEIDDDIVVPKLKKPLNISRSTMEKYPHIFASYLELQDNAFHSLPNLTKQHDTTLRETCSERMASLNSITAEIDAPPPTTYQQQQPGDVSMVDENYFIVYPDMSKETLLCGNPPCSKEQVPGKHGQDKFTSCPSCYICYCSRSCRHTHWPSHKQTCLVGFVNFYVHTFFRRCEKDPHVNEYLANLAHEAYQVFGRGCVMLRFQSPADIEFNALASGLNLSTQPVYKSVKKVISENKAHRHLNVLCQNIKDYDPEQEFVLSIYVWIGQMDHRNNTRDRAKCTAVVRSARISMGSVQRDGYDASILPYSIRTFSLPTCLYRGLDATEADIETRRYYCKEIAFGLKRYGVHLKSEYPEAYEKLYRYIDQALLFTPIILYGKRNGRNFKCILYSGKVEKTSSDEFYGAGAFV